MRSLPLVHVILLTCYYYSCSVLSYSQPRLIQGGMGIRISSYNLAREVARKGELGVVSGTVMDTILVRTLQDGDPGGMFRDALLTFPDQDMANRVLNKYFVEGGKEADKSYKSLPVWSLSPSQNLLEVAVLANYCEVYLAKHEEDATTPIGGPVGINLLTKVQLPTIPSLYGAMLADVDYVIMGAGIPMAIPRILDDLSKSQDCKLLIDIEGEAVNTEDSKKYYSEFSPSDFWARAGKPHFAMELKPKKRPAFLPIVSSVVLAQSMLKRATGEGPTKGIDGFVVELPTAGGHNAPPRGFRYDAVSKSHDANLNEQGEPIYGPKDEVDLMKFSKVSKGLPFWVAGSYARPSKLREVLECGGAGIQVGSAFSLCEESGLDDAVKQDILIRLSLRDLEVFTDPVASPTGFPFKVLQLDDDYSLSSEEQYLARPRSCSLGYLRTPYIKQNSELGYRCASEPIEDFIRKGGDLRATEGRKCLCNALCANAGFPQVKQVKREGKRDKYVEQVLITAGDDVNSCKKFMKWDEATNRWGFKASQVVDYLIGEWEGRQEELEMEGRGGADLHKSMI